MKKIRSGFETNSSSAHSLVIDHSDESVIHPISELGFIDEANFLNVDGETYFGWEWNIWNSPGDKVNYLYIDSGGSDERIQRLKDILMKNTGTFGVNFLSISDSKYDPYVDHQSRGNSEEVFEMTDDNIWRFIMNPNSKFRGGNDNEYGPWSNDEDE